MNQLRRWMLATGALFALASIVVATPVTYDVDLNTSTIAGTSGLLDFQFNPVAGALSATATLSNFALAGGTAIGPPILDGDAAGSLAGGVVLTNTGSLNALLQSVVFGNSARFTVVLSGPALDPPGSNAGTDFSFFAYDTLGNTILGGSNPAGAAALVTISEGVSRNVTGTGGAIVLNPVPEPRSFLSFASALGFFWCLQRRYAKKSRQSQQHDIK